jgi:uncharacterized protein (TIGR00290 family)
MLKDNAHRHDRPFARLSGAVLGKSRLDSLKGRRCMVSWSGGKDACLAMHRAVACGARVETLVNMKVEGGDRSRSHGLRSGVIEAQARALGMKLDGGPTSWEDYEERFVGVLRKLKDQGIAAGIFGDIDLQGHLDWEQMVCRRAGVIPVLPLWKGERMELVRELLQAGFEARIVAVRAGVLSPDYLGRILSLDLAEEFQNRGLDACGENGEFHTVVTDGPLFAHPVEILPGERVRKTGHWFLDFEVRDTTADSPRGAPA